MANVSPKLCTASDNKERLFENNPPKTSTIVINTFNNITTSILLPFEGI